MASATAAPDHSGLPAATDVRQPPVVVDRVHTPSGAPTTQLHDLNGGQFEAVGAESHGAHPGWRHVGGLVLSGDGATTAQRDSPLVLAASRG